jgi:O-antigen ligase
VFAIPGLVLLVVLDYFKPQEYVPFLAGLPLLYVFTALTLLGFLVDLRLGVSRLVPAPQLAVGLLFLAWSLLSNVPNGAPELLRKSFTVLVPFSLFFLIAHVVQTFRALQVLMAVVLAIGLGLAAVGTHQGLAPWGCHRLRGNDLTNLVFDGRPCDPEDRDSCYVQGEAEPGARYACERVGLLGTQTVGGRVRFRGTIEDPNELAIVVTTVIAVAFAFFDRRRGLRTFLLLAATVLLAGTCAVLTRSRGGQVVFLVVLGVYFVKRFGLRGLALGAAGAAPILLLGGRRGEEAAASASERINAWYAGIDMLRYSPLLGVGLSRFGEHHYLTAHNAYVQTAAELGLPGMVLWLAVIYLSVKIPLRALYPARGAAGPALAPVAASWALAILAMLAGTIAGMLFLSYAYKEALWVYVGLSGALYQAIRRHDPGFRVRFGWKDAALVATAGCALLAVTAVYTRLTVG